MTLELCHNECRIIVFRFSRCPMELCGEKAYFISGLCACHYCFFFFFVLLCAI